MVNVEPYKSIAEAERHRELAYGLFQRRQHAGVHGGDTGFVENNESTMVAYLQAWREIAADFKDRPKKVSDDIYGFFTSKGHSMSKDVFRKALGTVEVNPG
jgi:hypothetical protein